MGNGSGNAVRCSGNADPSSSDVRQAGVGSWRPWVTFKDISRGDIFGEEVCLSQAFRTHCPQSSRKDAQCTVDQAVLI